MHEILARLPATARVLDLGSASGSFDSAKYPFRTIAADIEASRGVRADAAALPFADHCFSAIVSNHSLEHFDNLAGALAEIGRVLQPDGSLYIAVPDASTITDRVYRWLGRGGGHVNPFRSAPDLATLIERSTGFRHVATRTLCTSLSFLNRKNVRGWPPKRLFLLGGGTEVSLRWLTYLFRLLDRWFGTRASVYGWALYFGNIDAPIALDTSTNVCIRCGSGHVAEWLLHGVGAVRRTLLLRTYDCPVCGTRNYFTDDSLKWSS